MDAKIVKSLACFAISAWNACNAQVSSEILGGLTCLPFVESPGQKTAKKP